MHFLIFKMAAIHHLGCFTQDPSTMYVEHGVTVYIDTLWCVCYLCRSVGGLRVSLYNAVTLEDVKQLATFMHDFQLNNSN